MTVRGIVSNHEVVEYRIKNMYKSFLFYFLDGGLLKLNINFSS